MQKRNVLQASESQISTAPKNGRQKKPIRKKKKASIEWGQLFRFAILLLLVGIIVFHYYLFTEKALVNYYQTIWMNYKHNTISDSDDPRLFINHLSFRISVWKKKKIRIKLLLNKEGANSFEDYRNRFIRSSQPQRYSVNCFSIT